MCREIESACKGSGRECLCLEREREGECTERERERERWKNGKCVQREGRSVLWNRGVCREIESACKGSGRECVCLDRGSVQRKRKKEREGKRWKDGRCVQREGRSVF